MEDKDLVDQITLINDMRDVREFKGVTFSNYKKNDVKKQLLLSIYNGKLEPACYWCAELVCSASFMDIWDVFILYLGKYIHIGNPKLAIYLNKRFQIFRNIMVQGFFFSELDLRNHKTIRSLFAEITCVFTHAQKKTGFETIKINKEEEFDLTKMSERLKADSISYTQSFLQKKDPPETTIALNELMYHITPTKTHTCNMMEACYWLEWLIEFDHVCKKRSQPCKCERRYDIPVETKFQCELIWMIWDGLLYNTKQSGNTFVNAVMTSLLDLFCIKFSTCCIKKRRFLLYFAIAMICEPFHCDLDIIQDKTILNHTLTQLPNIYKQIKKNEIRPKTDYLFSGMEDTVNLEISKKKMDWMNNVNIFSQNSSVTDDLM